MKKSHGQQQQQRNRGKTAAATTTTIAAAASDAHQGCQRAASARFRTSSAVSVSMKFNPLLLSCLFSIFSAYTCFAYFYIRERGELVTRKEKERVAMDSRRWDGWCQIHLSILCCFSEILYFLERVIIYKSSYKWSIFKKVVFFFSLHLFL